MAQAFPLSWPQGLDRTDPSKRVEGAMRTELNAALKNVTNSLRRFGEATGKQVSNIVLSSNASLGISSPADPGVAVWFLWDGRERCIALDRYRKLAANLQAINHVLEARITEARHGGLRIVQQTFSGFIALPAPSDVAGRSCWEILGIQPGASRERIIEAHRDKIRAAHPDAGGSEASAAELNAARDAALGQVAA